MSDNEAYIKDCVYSHLSASTGGGIQLLDHDFNINISLCYFDSCIATSTRQSRARKSVPSGGACFFDINSIFLANIYTTKCQAAGFGHAIYSCQQYKQNSYLRCITDSYSGKSVSPYSSIFAFEYCNFNGENVNSSYPKGINYMGVIHFGMDVYSLYNRYFNIIFTESESSAALGFALTKDCENNAEYFNIQNSGVSNAIIAFWKGIHILKHFNIINSSGNLEKIEVASDYSIDLYYSYIDSNVIISHAQQHESVSNNSLIFEILCNECFLYQGISSFSCIQTILKHKNNLNDWKALFLISLIKKS